MARGIKGADLFLGLFVALLRKMLAHYTQGRFPRAC